MKPTQSASLSQNYDDDFSIGGNVDSTLIGSNKGINREYLEKKIGGELEKCIDIMNGKSNNQSELQNNANGNNKEERHVEDYSNCELLFLSLKHMLKVIFTTLPVIITVCLTAFALSNLPYTNDCTRYPENSGCTYYNRNILFGVNRILRLVSILCLCFLSNQQQQRQVLYAIYIIFKEKQISIYTLHW